MPQSPEQWLGLVIALLIVGWVIKRWMDDD
jgi:hypothetical protein